MLIRSYLAVQYRSIIIVFNTLHITPQVKFMGFMGEVASYHVVGILLLKREEGIKHLHHYFLYAQLNHHLKIEAPMKDLVCKC